MLFFRKIKSKGNNKINILGRIKSKKCRISLVGSNSLDINKNFSCVQCVHINVDGINNKIVIGKDFISKGELLINVSGNNNLVQIGSCTKTLEGPFKIKIHGNNNKFIIGNNTTLVQYLNIEMGEGADNRAIVVGDDCSFFRTYLQNLDMNANVCIGDDCMFSYNTMVYNTDGHAIYQDGELINLAKDLNIGNHVWVGWNATILKNCNIPNGAIIGRNALVCKSFAQEKIAIGGNPAIIIKENVEWRRDTTSNAFIQEQELSRKL